MNHSCKFSVVQFVAHPIRNERMNVGIVVFGNDGIDVRVSKRLERVRSFSAAVDVEQVRQSILGLREIDAQARAMGAISEEQRLQNLSSFSGFGFSSAGSFDSKSSFDYENAIASLLQKLVEPEPAPARMTKGRSSRLLSTLKKALRQERILARKNESIDSHRVVSNYEIVEGLAANLVLKNGAMHVFEAVDALSDDASSIKVFKDIGYSTLVFEQARMTFGEAETRARLIYQASADMERVAKPALDAAAHQGAELVNWESREDRVKFVTTVTTLAEPIPTSSGGQSSHNVTSSTQQKFNLN